MLYPDIHLGTDKLIIEDGDISTTGGVMAWFDLGLRMIDRFISPVIMLDVARFFLVAPQESEQIFYSTFAPQYHHGGGEILKAQHWMQGQFRVGKAREPLEFSSLPLSQMAWKVGYEYPDAFRQSFKKIMGLSPGEYRQEFAVE